MNHFIPVTVSISSEVKDVLDRQAASHNLSTPIWMRLILTAEAQV